MIRNAQAQGFRKGDVKDMRKLILPMALALILFWGSVEALHSTPLESQARIKRLTYSGNGASHQPCLSHDGRKMLYTVEMIENEELIRSVRIKDLESGTEKELFRDGTQTAPAPYDEIPLILGSKPPLLSGNGNIAVFSLSVAEHANITDHFLAVIPTDGSGFWLTSFPISDFEGKDYKKMDFENGDWERIANYAVDQQGDRIACLVKGHLGPRRFGSASGIVLLDMQTKRQKTLIAPRFKEEEWKWDSSPQRPLSGGGWAFCMSADGRTIVFGAQNSNDPNDYDLYLAGWKDLAIKKLTDFKDRWFSLADIDRDGENIVFFYSGKKHQGIGTYIINQDGTGLRYLESPSVPRIEFMEYSDDGRFIFYKDVYRIMRLHLVTGKETNVVTESESSSLTEMSPLDFPNFPSFWMPRISSFDGSKILIAGAPRGKAAQEIFLCSTASK